MKLCVGILSCYELPMLVQYKVILQILRATIPKRCQATRVRLPHATPARSLEIPPF